MDKRSYLSLLTGFGLSAALFSSAFALTLLVKLFAAGRTNLLYLLGFSLAAAAAWSLTRYALNAVTQIVAEVPVRRARPQASAEQQVMLLARAAKGRLSAAEVAAATGLTADASHEVLEGLIRAGVAELWLSEGGGFVYAFPELLEGFKDGAKSPLAS